MARAPATAYGIVVTWGDGNQVYNNLIYGNQAGAQLYTGSTNTLFVNNTIYGNKNEAIALQYYGWGSSVRNNISIRMDRTLSTTADRGPRLSTTIWRPTQSSRTPAAVISRSAPAARRVMPGCR